MDIGFTEVCSFIVKHLPPLIAGILLALILLVTLLFKVLPGTLSICELIMPEKRRNARKELENMIRNKKKDFCEERVLFDDNPISKRKYYRRDLFLENNKKVKNISVKNDFIVQGEPGVGKSSYFRDIFFKNNGLQFTFGKRTLFFDYEYMKRLIDNKGELKKIVNFIKTADFSRLIILFDGIDEIGTKRFNLLINDVIPSLRAAQAKAIIGLSVREKFYDENKESFDDLFPRMKCYSVIPWTKEDARQYGYKLLESVNRNCKNIDSKKIKDRFDNDYSNKILRNPLTIKMYLYMLLNNPNMDLSRIENRYSLYDQFVDVLLCKNNNKYSEANRLEKRKKELSEGCFKAYANNDKLTDDSRDPKGLFKPNGMLIHETFFEFFVARYYFTTIIESDETNMFQKRVKVLELEYSNEYADFISDAVDSLNEEKQISFLKTLCNIYLYTLENEKLQKEFADIAGIEKTLEPNNITIISKEEKTGGECLFNLKMQIVFRFGRMDHTIIDPDLPAILNFLYKKDRNIYIKDDKIEDYYLILFKRGCAISSSIAEDFNVEIEIDYVKHMLDFCTHDPTYDLANRSHTIVFYGDINTGRSLFEFKDQACTVHPTKSIDKRIARLSNQIPDSLYELKGKDRKIYGFRLFDLATIYSFIISRNGEDSKDKIELSPEQISIIKRCRVCFKGQPKEREELMMEIRDRIIESQKNK